MERTLAAKGVECPAFSFQANGDALESAGVCISDELE
jgi:hypothetical protein